MKKILFSIVVISTVLASCSKSSTASGGSWTFGGNTYQALNCTTDSSLYTLTAYNTVSGNPFSNIVVSFYQHLPDSSGTYLVTKPSDISAAYPVGVTVAYQTGSATSYYGTTAGNGLNQKVNVTVANGRISVSSSSLEIRDLGGADSSKLTFSMRQTQ